MEVCLFICVSVKIRKINWLEEILNRDASNVSPSYDLIASPAICPLHAGMGSSPTVIREIGQTTCY